MVVGHAGVVVGVVAVTSTVVGGSATVDVVNGSVVVVSSNRVVVGDSVVVVDDALGAGAVVTMTGGMMTGGMTTGSTVVEVVVEIDVRVVEVVLVDDVLVDDVAVPIDPDRRSTLTTRRGPDGEDVRGDGSSVDGTVLLGVIGVVVRMVEVVVEVDVINTREVGPIRSGIRRSVPSMGPPNSVMATTPTSASTTPLDAAMIADRCCHHGGAGGS